MNEKNFIKFIIICCTTLHTMKVFQMKIKLKHFHKNICNNSIYTSYNENKKNSFIIYKNKQAKI